MAPGGPYYYIRSRVGLSSVSDRAYPTLLHAPCSLAPGGIVLRRLGSCLVVVFLAVAGICRASRVHGHLDIVEE